MLPGTSLPADPVESEGGKLLVGLRNSHRRCGERRDCLAIIALQIDGYLHMYRGVNVSYPIPVKITSQSKARFLQVSHGARHNDGRVAQAEPGGYRPQIPARSGRQTGVWQHEQPVQRLTRWRPPNDDRSRHLRSAAGAFIFVILPHAGFARRTLSVGIFLTLIAVVYVGASELLGRRSRSGSSGVTRQKPRC